MKRFFKIIWMGILLLSLLWVPLIFIDAAGPKREVNVFTWAMYIPDQVVKKFEKETGIKVNYSLFSSNEEMLAKLQAVKGSQYDVIVCSDYIIEVMRKQKDKLIQPIDKSKISNIQNIDPNYLNQDFDPGNKYSLPYVAGSPMIIYNSDKVKIPIKGYKDLWNPALKDSVVIVDDSRTVIGIALKKLGYSVNETDPKRLNQAKEELKKLRPNIKIFDADTPHNSLISGDVTVGFMFGSQASAAVKANPHFKIVYPEEGILVGIDNFVIPVKAPHKKEAEALIDFILDGKNNNLATSIIEYVSTNKAARKYMSGSYLNNPAVYLPPQKLKGAEHLVDIGAAAKTYDLIWSEFKQ
jgi:Spermidine/putrescine-binding periplasmic protein